MHHPNTADRIGLAHQLARLFVAATLLAAALAAWQLALPTSAFACSCAAGDPNAPVFTGEEHAVFIGTAGRPLPNGAYEFAVERWYRGGQAAQVQVASEREPMGDGGMAINSCGLHFEVGDRFILTAGTPIEGVYAPGLCLPHAVVATAEGARLIAAAEAAFGPGAPPGEVPPDDAPPAVGDAAFSFDLATAALVAVGVIVLLAVIVVGYATTHRDTGGDRA
jgi:hypothetical protein